jgi:phosphoglycerate dehydrogenase-like enzyme
MKIVVTNNWNYTEEQKERLNKLGDTTWYEGMPKSKEEYLVRVKGADVICSGTAGLKESYVDLKDVFVTVAFVSVAFIENLDVLKQNNVQLSNSPGANRHAVAEWIMTMALLLMRELAGAINKEETYRVDGGVPPMTQGLAGNKMTILGKGNVGKQVANLAQAFDMDVSFFTRGDNLYQAVQATDIVVDTLSSNSLTTKLLDEKFFQAMKEGSYFVSVTRSEIIDQNALLDALDSDHLAGAATDCGDALVGDTEDSIYQKYQKHPKVLATPHIAYSSIMSEKTGADIMIDNVEAFINGKPQNLVV